VKLIFLQVQFHGRACHCLSPHWLSDRFLAVSRLSALSGDRWLFDIAPRSWSTADRWLLRRPSAVDLSNLYARATPHYTKDDGENDADDGANPG
jgi:hypothetical protein